MGQHEATAVVLNEPEMADHHVAASEGLQVKGHAVLADEDPQPVAVVGLVLHEHEHLPRGLIGVDVGVGAVVCTDRI